MENHHLTTGDAVPPGYSLILYKVEPRACPREGGGNGGVDLRQGIVFGIQSGVAIVDIEKNPSEPCPAPPALLVDVVQ